MFHSDHQDEGNAMLWEKLYPSVSNQAYWSVLRYDHRRLVKVKELICPSYNNIE
jgi:hypothetical protein